MDLSAHSIHRRSGNTASISVSSGGAVNQNLTFKTAKHRKKRNFFSRQSKNPMVRLTPTMGFFCSIGKKEPFCGDNILIRGRPSPSRSFLTTAVSLWLRPHIGGCRAHSSSPSAPGADCGFPAPRFFHGAQPGSYRRCALWTSGGRSLGRCGLR